MGNNYFQFKQFSIQQENCAMKVCTDACIFGAYVADRLNKTQPVVKHILDIGTGTGLLSLMVAQKTNALIDAVEIDAAASRQAMINFDQSPWKERLTIYNSAAQDFYSGRKYGSIISNPPFFEGDLKSGNKKNDAAKHDTSLTLAQLLPIVDSNLSPNGFFAVLLPFQRVHYFIKIATQANYFLVEQVSIRDREERPFFRAILCFKHNKTMPASNELVIKKEQDYTPGFKALLKDYYLNL